MKLIRESTLRADLHPVGKTKLFNDVKNGDYPPPVKIGERAVAWIESEAIAMNAARAAGKSGDEIKALVKQLVAKRAGATA